MKQFLTFLCASAVLLAQHATKDDWPHYGGERSSWRYSELNQINAANVKKFLEALGQILKG